MFPVFATSDEFIQWTYKTEEATRFNPSVNFFVAYSSFERYLFRTRLALSVFQGKTNNQVRADKQGIESLSAFCGHSHNGGNPKLACTMDALGFRHNKLGLLKMRRNGIAHGADLGSRDAALNDSSLLWKALRAVAILPFAETSRRGPYYAWQKLPIRRRAHQKPTAQRPLRTPARNNKML
jgi:hypothetical protein